jgi:uncharacterized membrane protein
MYYTNTGDPFLHLLFIILVVALIIWVVRAIMGPRRFHRGSPWMGRMHGGSPALSILEERYAKGEISKEEFDTRRKDLLNY